MHSLLSRSALPSVHTPRPVENASEQEEKAVGGLREWFRHRIHAIAGFGALALAVGGPAYFEAKDVHLLLRRRHQTNALLQMRRELLSLCRNHNGDHASFRSRHKTAIERYESVRVEEGLTDRVPELCFEK